MKKILITGENSYIGNSVEQWLNQSDEEYTIDKISVRNNEWENQAFGSYHAILHFAGIVHRKETKENEDLYYKVNRDLTYSLAKKAKSEGCSHFIFLSTMSVYGTAAGIIDADTELTPKNAYGKSKLQAEKEILKLSDADFKVSIVRPPMVYGKNAVGNYSLLSKFAKRVRVFPKIKNQRSMIFIDNLCEFLRLLIDSEEGGTYCPQNSEYVSTSEMVREIGKVHGKQIKLVSWFDFAIHYTKNLTTVSKIFGDLTYSKELSCFEKYSYQIADFEKSIVLSEQVN